jgi:hypothetical protein
MYAITHQQAITRLQSGKCFFSHRLDDHATEISVEHSLIILIQLQSAYVWSIFIVIRITQETERC